MARSKKKDPDANLSPRERVKRYLVQRFYTRFHMSLILISAGFAAMLVNWGLLHAGVGKMWVRYPLAVGASYLTFLAGVWLWIQYVKWRRESAAPARAIESKRSALDGADAIDLVPSPSGGGGGGSMNIADAVRGGGGNFDGGGASGGWDDVVPVQSMMSSPDGGAIATPSGGSGFSFDFGDLDGDGLVLILLALALAAVVLVVSGYIVWFAPDILTEALFGAALAGSVAKAAKREDAQGWVLGVVKKTWWPFAIVLVVAMGVAIYAQSHYPQARTLGEALAAATA
jgi:hypothetical protein